MVQARWLTELRSLCAAGPWCGHEPCGASPRWWEPPAYRSRLHHAEGRTSRPEGRSYCCPPYRSPQGYRQGSRQGVSASVVCVSVHALARTQTTPCCARALHRSARTHVTSWYARALHCFVSDLRKTVLRGGHPENIPMLFGKMF